MPGRHDEYDESMLSACETNCEADQEFSKKKKIRFVGNDKKVLECPSNDHRTLENIQYYLWY